MVSGISPYLHGGLGSPVGRRHASGKNESTPGATRSCYTARRSQRPRDGGRNMSRLRIEVAGVMRELGVQELRRLPGVRHQDAIGVSLAILLDALRVPGS